MKRLPFFAAAATLLFLASCSKENTGTCTTDSGSNLRSTSAETNDDGGLSKNDFSYHLEKDPLTQEWLCPEPMDDCSRVSLSSARMEELNEMIENNTVQNYFATRTTAVQFPWLDHSPEIKTGLAQGRFTIIKELNSAGDVFYMVVKNGTVANGDHPRTEQVVHTLMVPATSAKP
ncbi:MAG: hypothetical protein ACRC3B_17740 [Bacteroidia bacterium]